MKYLFIIGRNEDLSIAEIEEYLVKENNPAQKLTLVDNGLLIETDKPLKKRAIDALGGTISIGEVMAYGDDEKVFKELDKIMIYMGTSNKLTYVLWDFSDIWEETKEYLKARFKSEKLKTAYKGLTGKVQMQDGEKGQKPSSKLIDEEYFIFQESGKQYFGKITQKCDYASLEKRDMEKPVRRESLAIAPRLAKIMINLAHLKENDTLLDPFCGVGTMLQEGLLQRIKAVGVDLNAEAIKSARKNLRWFKFKPEFYELFHGNSTDVEIPEVTAVATEPDLGAVLKKIPTKEIAGKTLQQFDNLMINVIKNIRPNVKGRIVFTSPYIRIGKKRVACNIEAICEQTGYELTRDGIAEYRGNQVVGRMIYVLEKVKGFKPRLY